MENKELFYNLINTSSRENCCVILGTTIPTLQRWISKDEYPSYVDIILEQRESLKSLQSRLDYQKMKVIEVKQTVSNFVNASSALKDLLSD